MQETTPVLSFCYLDFVRLFPFLSPTSPKHGEHSTPSERHWQAILSSSGFGSRRLGFVQHDGWFRGIESQNFTSFLWYVIISDEFDLRESLTVAFGHPKVSIATSTSVSPCTLSTNGSPLTSALLYSIVRSQSCELSVPIPPYQYQRSLLAYNYQRQSLMLMLQQLGKLDVS